MKIGSEITINGQAYTITEMLGSGGFAAVFKAEQSGGTGREDSCLAIKIPRFDISDHEELRKRFERESRVLANISHPNVARIISLTHDEDTGNPAIVQEFVEGARELSSCDAESGEWYFSVLLQVLYALRSIHGPERKARAIHRDLSPRNILVKPDGQVKVIDFGLAKEDRLTSTLLTIEGKTLGTPGCIAPEQENDAADVDRRVDFYSLGRSMASVIQERGPAHVDVSRIDEPWQAILERMTAYNPEERFDTADLAIAHILDEFRVFGMKIAHPMIHFREFEKWGSQPKEWVLTVQRIANSLPCSEKWSLAIANYMREPVLRHRLVDIDRFFGKLNAGVIEDEFGQGGSNFEACDSLGAMLASWYLFLGMDKKKECFRRLVCVAVGYHRFTVMRDVRKVYDSEGDEDMKIELLKVLEEEDPDHVIEGRGMIPR